MKEDYFSHLTPEEQYILKDKGTEDPFTGEYNDFYQAGVFICRACKSPLYESNDKFNSGCGWPSFDDEIEGAIVRYEDLSAGRVRVEICCAKCDGHLGHVFHGEQITPKDTRHCVNSLSIQFKSYENLQKAFFGSTCFWNLQKIFNTVKGLYMSSVGYMNTETKIFKHKDIDQRKVDPKKVIELYFDPTIVSYYKLLNVFLENQDRMNINEKSNKSIIFYYSEEQKKITQKLLLKKWKRSRVIKLISASNFYRAKEYHQNYFEKTPNRF